MDLSDQVTVKNIKKNSSKDFIYDEIVETYMLCVIILRYSTFT